MKSLFSRIADAATAIVIVVLALGMLWNGSFLFFAELPSADGVPPGISMLIVFILASVAVICGYAAYRSQCHSTQRTIYPSTIIKGSPRR
jgi:protein-S-isoprenylcysteine O-methyltransferase Ste14